MSLLSGSQQPDERKQYKYSRVICETLETETTSTTRCQHVDAVLIAVAGALIILMGITFSSLARHMQHTQQTSGLQQVHLPLQQTQGTAPPSTGSVPGNSSQEAISDTAEQKAEQGDAISRPPSVVPPATQQDDTSITASNHFTTIEADKDIVGRRSRSPWANRTRPYVIAHRGASGLYPEHTLQAYLTAIEQGADIIECDVVLTKDLIGICRHDPNLIGSTNAKDLYPEYEATYLIDGQNQTGIFAADLTLDQIRKLLAVQPWPFRDQQYNGKFAVVTLEEYIDIALAANRTVGVYPETKNPTWHNSLPHVKAGNTSIEAVLLTALKSKGYTAAMNSEEWLKQPAFIQSFEISSLRAMSRQTCLPLILLLEGHMSDAQPEGMTVEDVLAEESLQDLKQFVTGFGVGKTLLVTWQGTSSTTRSTSSTTGSTHASTSTNSNNAIQPKTVQKSSIEEQDTGTATNQAGNSSSSGSSNKDNRTSVVPSSAGRKLLLSQGAADKADGNSEKRYLSSGVLELLHATGFQVHIYTLREEQQFWLQHLDSSQSELDLLVDDVGVDAAFTDYTSTMVSFLEKQQQSGRQWNMSVVNQKGRCPWSKQTVG